MKSSHFFKLQNRYAGNYFGVVVKMFISFLEYTKIFGFYYFGIWHSTFFKISRLKYDNGLNKFDSITLPSRFRDYILVNYEIFTVLAYVEIIAKEKSIKIK